ncbi:MAG: high frequency lysogenization protein HflD [Pseudomonadales bacterium]|nr:high frequency lysogenization protein HflD [Pseudomonadales bacterium]
MLSLLLIGFLIGMRHALEADHMAAVASLASGSQSLSETIKHGLVWGLGHTLTLFLFGSVVLWLDIIMPTQLANALEFAVGVMLIVLGADVLRRVYRDRVHFHTHSHGEEVHFHAHAHPENKPHTTSKHQHNHPKTFPVKALFIGLMHGMAGSAALILLTLETIQSPWIGMLYIALFGIGSMLGMAMLSAVIIVPLKLSSSKLTWAHNALQITIGTGTIGLGGWIMMDIGLA